MEWSGLHVSRKTAMNLKPKDEMDQGNDTDRSFETGSAEPRTGIRCH